MPDPARSSLLEDAIDIPTWLEADGARPLAERIHRDRAIGRGLPTNADAAARIRAWWGALAADTGDSLSGRRLDHARSWINLALAFLGLVAGAGLALAAFRYDGSYPVNVIRLLALLVVPQLLLLALNLFLIPGRLPGLRFVQDALAAINPGALAGAVYRQLAGRRDAAGFAFATAPTAAMRRFGKWQMLVWSQIAAVAFNAGVIATAAVLIAFTDLAFGWSTTLGIDSDTAGRVFAAIAAPWAGIFPGAVPDAALIERSQFFRLDGAAALPESRALAGWWAFSVLAVVTYGLLPRIAFLVVALWRLRVATRRMLLDDPRVAALLERMAAPDLETRSTTPAESPPLPAPAADTVSPTELAGTAGVVIWSQCVAADRVRELVRSRLGLVAGTVLDAGGGSLADERATLERIGGTAGPIVVLTPAWEPPLLEFVDFLGALRGRVGPARAIVVLPVAGDGETIQAIERDNWRRAVGRARDPNTRIAAEDA